MPRRGHDTRDLHLKIRVTVTRRMTVGTMRKLLERAIATGVVPTGIHIRWIDWAKAGGSRSAGNADRIPEPHLSELRAWYGAFVRANVKFGVVDRGGER